MEFSSLTGVLAHEFVGNFAADNEAFDAITRFVEQAQKSGRREEQKLAELHAVLAGMGLDEDLLDEESAQFLATYHRRISGPQLRLVIRS